MDAFLRLHQSIYNSQLSDKTAFYIGEIEYSYMELRKAVSGVRNVLSDSSESLVGLVSRDDLHTYASIFAIWLEGKAYSPLPPDSPEERNQSVIHQTEIKLVLDSKGELGFGAEVVHTALLSSDDVVAPKKAEEDNLAYVLFTSGSSGTPKGVSIQRKNLSAFIDALEAFAPLKEDDRVLQMFDLTFDLSVMSFFAPIINGATVYTVPNTVIKPLFIFDLLDDHDITYALMVPSVINYLRKYFDEIDCPKMRYNLFCGEALTAEVVEEWIDCLPNAQVFNVYGPTENTIFCTYYQVKKDSKEQNGVVSIGKEMMGCEMIVVDENNTEVVGQAGELCLAGKQLTPGYWKNEDKNRSSFFDFGGTRYYRSGDQCTVDESGDVMYLGRIDFQVKIQGFRIELAEVEFHAKAILTKKNLVAVAFHNKMGNTELGIAIEGSQFDLDEFKGELKGRMPSYMQPSRITFLNEFPLTRSGKIDRKIITKSFEDE